MNQRLIYIDQWAWIRLARVHYGKDANPELSLVLEFIRAARAAGVARFPLSLAHYLETSKHSSPGRRRRLAAFMAEISELDTLASLGDVVDHEIDASLRSHFGGRVSVKPLSLLGKGVGHALGSPVSLALDDPSGLLTEEQRRKLEVQANAVLEFGVLAGPDTVGVPDNRKRAELDDVAGQFVEILERLPDEVSGLPAEQIAQDAYICGRCIGDLRQAINRRLEQHGIAWEELQGLGPVGLMKFVEAMPTRKVNMHLLRQFASNRSLKRTKSDLNDWEYLGLAASYCDVVVAEKQFADLVNRGNLDKKATVISSLGMLPAL